MAGNKADSEAVASLATQLSELPWPTAASEADDVLRTLGFEPMAPGLQYYTTTLPITPPLAQTTVRRGEVVSVEVFLTDGSKDTSAERDEFQHEAFGEFSNALQGVFGQ